MNADVRGHAAQVSILGCYSVNTTSLAPDSGATKGHCSLPKVLCLPSQTTLRVKKELMLSPFSSIATGKNISKVSLNHLYRAVP